MEIRQKELNLLNNEYIKPTSSFGFIFGRRKMGKTSLINRFTKDKTTLYFSAFETLPDILLNRFLVSLASFFKMNYKSLNIKNFEELFIFISKQELNEKLVIVFENFNLMEKIEKNFLKTFYLIWSKFLRKKNILFIISSSNNFSKKEYESILKKASFSITLENLPFKVINHFVPDLNQKDFLYVYAVFGTNPYYLRFYDSKKDFLTNLKDIIFNPSHFLFNEGNNILKNELSEVTTYSAILYAVSKGNRRIGDIADFLKLKSSYLTRYLQNLVDLMILKKELPVNEENERSKFGRYKIEDNFLRFWFSYIYANSNPNKNDYNMVFNYIKEDLNDKILNDAYKEYSFELISGDKEKYYSYSPIKMGKWWNNKNNEIDIVAYDNKNITFIDCKLNGKNRIEEFYSVLQKKSDEFETSLNKKYAIFTH